LPAGKFGWVLRSILLGFSCSSLFRYVPYLFTGEYTPFVLQLQVAITFLGGLTISIFVYIMQEHFLRPRPEA
jgi:hypothetical protein